MAEGERDITGVEKKSLNQLKPNLTIVLLYDFYYFSNFLELTQETFKLIPVFYNEYVTCFCTC